MDEPSDDPTVDSGQVMENEQSESHAIESTPSKDQSLLSKAVEAGDGETKDQSEEIKDQLEADRIESEQVESGKAEDEQVDSEGSKADPETVRETTEEPIVSGETGGQSVEQEEIKDQPEDTKEIKDQSGQIEKIQDEQVESKVREDTLEGSSVEVEKKNVEEQAEIVDRTLQEIKDQVESEEIKDQAESEEIKDQLESEEITGQIDPEEINDQVESQEIKDQVNQIPEINCEGIENEGDDSKDLKDEQVDTEEDEAPMSQEIEDPMESQDCNDKVDKEESVDVPEETKEQPETWKGENIGQDIESEDMKDEAGTKKDVKDEDETVSTEITPMNEAIEAVRTDNMDDVVDMASDEELILEDQTGEDEEPVMAETTTAKSEEENHDSSGDAIELIETDEIIVDENEDDDDGSVFSPKILRMYAELQNEAAKLMDSTSPTNVYNLPEEWRAAMAKYSRAIFDWFAALPDSSALSDVTILMDIDLPFPLKKPQLVMFKADLGVRLKDMWRQTKSLSRIGAHYKVDEKTAVMALLHCAFNTPNYEPDVVPLLQEYQISFMGYHVVAKHVLQYKDERNWKSPVESCVELLLSPAELCVALYVVHREATKGVSARIPWESITIRTFSIPRDQLHLYEDTLRDAVDQLRLPDLEEEEKALEEQARLEELVNAMIKETEEARENLNRAQDEFVQMRKEHDQILMNRRRGIGTILPIGFVESGEKLAEVEQEIEVIESEIQIVPDLQNVSREIGLEEMIMLGGEKILLREKNCASARFMDGIYVSPKKDREVIVQLDTVDSVPFHTSICNIAFKERKIPIMCEGLRVVAEARHPCKPNLPGLYSGTIGARFDINKQQYLIFFDDNFDMFVNARKTFLMADQPFHNGVFRKELVYKYLAPNLNDDAASYERSIFMERFWAKYPYWLLVKMTKKQRINARARDGSSKSAIVIDVDRAVCKLRFDQQTGPDGGCTLEPCTRHAKHDEEWMWRGSVRLAQIRNEYAFEKLMSEMRNSREPRYIEDNDIVFLPGPNPTTAALMYDRLAVSNSKQNRRQRRHNNVGGGNIFEPAVPDVRRALDESISSQRKTMRKSGMPSQFEPSIRPAVPKKRVFVSQKKTVHHNVEKLTYHESMYHTSCNHECLKGMDADPSLSRFHSYSPFFIPVMCGWRRMRETHTKRKGARILVYYRAPCSRTLNFMSDIADYLENTRSELTIDLFSFDPKVDETRSVMLPAKFKVLDDYSNGREGRPLPVYNEVDSEKIPDFQYCARRFPMTDKVNLTTINKQNCSGCSCTDNCRDWTKCECQRLTYKEAQRVAKTFPSESKGYIDRRLNEKMFSGVYECNDNCACNRKRCFNRVVQNDIKIPLQIMKTPGMGWGLRTLVDLPPGTFVCNYNGGLLTDAIAESWNEGDEYFADLDMLAVVEDLKANAGTDLLEDAGVDVNDEIDEKEKARVAAAEARQRRADRRASPNDEPHVEEDEEEDEGVDEGGGDDSGAEMDGGDGSEEKSEDGDGDGGGGRGGGAKKARGDSEEQASSSDAVPMEQEPASSSKTPPTQDASQKAKSTEPAAPKFLLPIKDERDRFRFEQYFENEDITSLYIIDAKTSGNLGRLLNHSCDPNIMVQHVLVDTHDLRLPWVAFFTKRFIEAGEELCWDYGWNPSDNPDERRGLKCNCGAENCKVDLL